jgi:hypothetical protein
MICLDLWTQLIGYPLDLKEKKKETNIKTVNNTTNVLLTNVLESGHSTGAL